MNRLRGRWLSAGLVAVIVASIAQGLSARVSHEAFSSDAWLVVYLLVVVVPAFLQARERASVRAGLAAGILLELAIVIVGVPISIVFGGEPFIRAASADVPLVIGFVLAGSLILGAALGTVAGIVGRLVAQAR